MYVLVTRVVAAGPPPGTIASSGNSSGNWIGHDMSIAVFDNNKALSQEVAVKILNLASQCIAENGKFSMAISGGSLPKETLQHDINLTQIMF